MAISTRGVIALLTGALLIAGMVAPRVGRGVLGSWLLAIGLSGAAVWSAMSVIWAGGHESAAPAETYLAMAAMAVAGAAYFADRANRRRPPG